MTRHNIIGSEVGQRLSPGHGSMRQYPPRMKSGGVVQFIGITLGVALGFLILAGLGHHGG